MSFYLFLFESIVVCVWKDRGVVGRFFSLFLYCIFSVVLFYLPAIHALRGFSVLLLFNVCEVFVIFAFSFL